MFAHCALVALHKSVVGTVEISLGQWHGVDVIWDADCTQILLFTSPFTGFP